MVNVSSEGFSLGTGRQKLKEGRYQEAITIFKKIIDANPHYTEGWQFLGQACFADRDFAGAENAYEQAIVLAPQEGVASYLRGYMRWYQGQHALALQDLRRAERSDLDDYDYPERFWYLARVEESFGCITFALQDYNAYQRYSGSSGLKPHLEIERLKQHPKTSPIYGLSWAGVVSLAGSAANQQPEAPEQTAQQSSELYCRGKYQEVITLFRQLVATAPDNERAWRYLGHACWYAGQEADAAQAFDRALQLAPTQPENLFCRGCLYYMKQAYPQALLNFNQAKSLELPTYLYPSLYQYRADIYERQGQVEQAIQNYRAYDQAVGQRVYDEHTRWLGRKK